MFWRIWFDGIVGDKFFDEQVKLFIGKLNLFQFQFPVSVIPPREDPLAKVPIPLPPSPTPVSNTLKRVWLFPISPINKGPSSFSNLIRVAPNILKSAPTWATMRFWRGERYQIVGGQLRSLVVKAKEWLLTGFKLSSAEIVASIPVRSG